MGYSQDEAGFRRKQMPDASTRSSILNKCQPIKDLGTKEQHKRENPRWTGRLLPFMPSVPWAFGPSILVKVRLPVIPFLVATLFGMTEWLDDSRRSVAKHLFMRWKRHESRYLSRGCGIGMT